MATLWSLRPSASATSGDRLGRLGSFDGTAAPISPCAGVLEHLGRSDDLEFFAGGAERHHRPRQRVRHHVQAAPLIVDFHDGSPSADAGADDMRRGVHHRLHVVASRQRVDAAPDEVGRIAGRKLARGEMRARGMEFREAVQAEAPPVCAGGIPGHQVPPPAEEDQPVWIDEALSPLAIAGGVGELQPPTKWHVALMRSSPTCPTSITATLCPRHHGSRRADTGQLDGCSSTSSPRRLNMPDTPTSSVRPWTAPRRWGSTVDPGRGGRGGRVSAVRGASGHWWQTDISPGPACSSPTCRSRGNNLPW